MRQPRWTIDADDPRRLALLRIGVFGYIAFAIGTEWVGPESIWQLRHWATIPQDVMIPPGRYEWIVEANWSVFSPSLVVVLGLVMLGCAVAAAAGWRVPVTGGLVAAIGAYVWLLPQLMGKVNHYHHLVLIAVVLTASPCTEVWSVCRTPAATPVRHRVGNYGTWLVLGVVYLFPGLAKLTTPGWATADTMERLILAQRAIGQATDAVPLELLPLAILGPAAIVFELSFLPAMLISRWTRLALAIMGVAFHAASVLLLGIVFLSIAPVYLSLVPLKPRTSAQDGSGSQTTMPTRATYVQIVLVALVVVGLAVSGAMGRQADWPFAAYPFMDSIPGTSGGVPVLHVDGQPMEPNAQHPWMSRQRAQFYLSRSVRVGHAKGVEFLTGLDLGRVDIVMVHYDLLRPSGN